MRESRMTPPPSFMPPAPGSSPGAGRRRRPIPGTSSSSKSAPAASASGEQRFGVLQAIRRDERDEAPGGTGQRQHPQFLDHGVHRRRLGGRRRQRGLGDRGAVAELGQLGVQRRGQAPQRLRSRAAARDRRPGRGRREFGEPGGGQVQDLEHARLARGACHPRQQIGRGAGDAHVRGALGAGSARKPSARARSISTGHSASPPTAVSFCCDDCAACWRNDDSSAGV